MLKRLKSNEIQLNTPSRPRVLVRQLDARDNNITESNSDIYQNLRCVSTNVLSTLAQQIYTFMQIPVRFPPTPPQQLTVSSEKMRIK